MTLASPQPATVQRQITLPLSKAVEIAWKSIRMRLSRSLLVTSGIVLALAFLDVDPGERSGRARHARVDRVLPNRRCDQSQPTPEQRSSSRPPSSSQSQMKPAGVPTSPKKSPIRPHPDALAARAWRCSSRSSAFSTRCS